jgi:SAM-dependent methyltransferase
MSIANPVVRGLWRMRHRARLRRRLRPGFTFRGERYPFHVAQYNATWLNERQVEVPVALRALRDAPGPRVLEVGNVLAHYRRIRHAVVDKYERHAAARNEDFLDHAGGPYDLVVSVSTFEHIGWDEPGRDAGKFLLALDRARSLLAPGGRLLVTVPLGYNPAVDAFVQAPSPGFEVGFLRRTGPGPGEWQEAGRVDPVRHPYGVGCDNASAVAVIEAAGPDGRPRAGG